MSTLETTAPKSMLDPSGEGIGWTVTLEDMRQAIAGCGDLVRFVGSGILINRSVGVSWKRQTQAGALLSI